MYDFASQGAPGRGSRAESEREQASEGGCVLSGSWGSGGVVCRWGRCRGCRSDANFDHGTPDWLRALAAFSLKSPTLGRIGDYNSGSLNPADRGTRFTYVIRDFPDRRTTMGAARDPDPTPGAMQRNGDRSDSRHR